MPMAWLFCICTGNNYGLRDKSMTILKRGESVIVIDITSESQVDEELQGARELASQNVDCDIVIQFPPISTINPSSIVKLTKLQKSLKLSGRRLILFSVSPETNKIFWLTSLYTFFEFATDYNAALSKLQETSRNLD